MHLCHPIPILRIFSEERAREFYLDFLGFTLAWEHRFEPGLPLYAQIARGDLTIHLSEHHGDATPGSTIFVPVDDIKALHAELHDRQYGYARPSIDAVPYGQVMEVADPFGNRIRFCEYASTK
jgi:catechol 2,3-dioxygenase-like lactoylglutathione lyase family enzyme